MCIVIFWGYLFVHFQLLGFVNCETLRVLRVVRGSGYFPAVSSPIRVNKLPFLTEQFVRMSAEVISLGL